MHANTTTPYIHLFTFPHVSAVAFDDHQAQET